MKMLRAWCIRLAGIFSRGRREGEIADELSSHLQMHVDDGVRAGMAPEEARREAVLKLGGLESTRQAYRERGTVPFLETLGQDLRFAARQLRKSPGFTTTAVLMLALGIAASVAIFAFVDAALLKPLPYPNPKSLVEVTESVAALGRANLSYLDYLDWKRMNHSFGSFDVYTGTGFLLTTASGTEPVGCCSDAGTGFLCWRGPAERATKRHSDVSNVDEALWRQARCDWAGGFVERRAVYDRRRDAAEFCVCASEWNGVLDYIACSERLRAQAQLP
jgi:hypothetical protein